GTRVTDAFVDVAHRMRRQRVRDALEGVLRAGLKHAPEQCRLLRGPHGEERERVAGQRERACLVELAGRRGCTAGGKRATQQEPGTEVRAQAGQERGRRLREDVAGEIRDIGYVPLAGLEVQHGVARRGRVVEREATEHPPPELAEDALGVRRRAHVLRRKPAGGLGQPRAPSTAELLVAELVRRILAPERRDVLLVAVHLTVLCGTSATLSSGYPRRRTSAVRLRARADAA